MTYRIVTLAYRGASYREFKCIVPSLLNTDSLFILRHVDFLIEKLKEINEPEKAETLENIKKRAGEAKQGALGYIQISHKKYF